MRERIVVDVSALPAVASGPRTTIWWGVIGLLTIEGTMFGLLVATYFYLKLNFLEWPPTGTPPPDLLDGTLNMLLLLGSIWPMIIAHRAALDEHRRPIWNATLAQVAIDYGFTVERCTPRSPEQKGAVENLVGYVKWSFFAPDGFLDLEQDLPRQLLECWWT